jgi:hypothetical protein
MEASVLSRVTFDSPAVYRIRVKGRIRDGWVDRLSGISVVQVETTAGQTVTMLEGTLVDQAALAGVLNSLYELHLPVLLVECVNPDG